MLYPESTLYYHHIKKILVLCLFFIPLHSYGQSKVQKNYSGTWQFNLGENDIVQRVQLSSKGDSLCGQFFGQSFCGKVTNDLFLFNISDFYYTGYFKGDNHIEGSFKDKDGTVSTWKGLKEIENKQPKSFVFEPTIFHRNYSSLEKPVLRLVSGDTVKTSTVDASGTDKDYKKLTWGGNPLTGPFYLENAMETSMDFQFSVALLKSKSQPIPRAENKDFINSIGIAATLDQAMKLATTDLTRWLETEYHLKEPEAAMIMGFSVEYEIPDLVGSNISVTAKISKFFLSSLQTIDKSGK